MSQDSYLYEALPPGKVFRYITLEPGVETEALRCRLQTGTICDTQFEAISYVWGPVSTKDQQILCNGHTMAITSSLFNVLQRIRSPTQPLVLWADSISINQNNLKEKGHQVALMGKIYRAAQRVLIYVGSDDGDEASCVSSLLDEVEAMIEGTCENIDMSWDSFPYLDEDDPILADTRWNALHVLLAKDWFDRGWVCIHCKLRFRDKG
jgi:hypothetical protein